MADGCSAACALEGCVPVTALACNATVSSRNDAAGSKDLIDEWSCSIFTYTGPEISYRFVAPVAGLVEVALTGLTADLDLIVMRDDGNGCSHDGAATCVDKSTLGGTGDERVSFVAETGATYFIILDGFNGAVGDFTLRVGSLPSHVQLNELAGAGSDLDYIELLNRSACPVGMTEIHLEHQGTCDDAPTAVSFAGTGPLAGGATARQGAAGELLGDFMRGVREGDAAPRADLQQASRKGLRADRGREVDRVSPDHRARVAEAG